MNNKKILVVDDDPTIITLLSTALTKAGATTVTAPDGQAGLQQFYAHRPDLVFLDVVLSEPNSWETCRIMRQLSNVPIIMLSNHTTDEDIIRGLDSGADDYISKPFNTRVALARARATLRRVSQQAMVPGKAITYSDGYLTIDLTKNMVLVQGEVVKLISLEYRLLAPVPNMTLSNYLPHQRRSWRDLCAGIAGHRFEGQCP